MNLTVCLTWRKHAQSRISQNISINMFILFSINAEKIGSFSIWKNSKFYICHQAYNIQFLPT